jgi:ankyrin repeat protein
MTTFSPLADYALSQMPNRCIGTALLTYAFRSHPKMFESDLNSLSHISKTVDELAVLPITAFIQGNSENRTRLNHAIYHKKVDRVKRILDVAPDAAKVVGTFGYTPLHIACMNYGVPTETLRMLLEVYPEAAMIKEENGFVPLHWEFNTGRQSIEHIQTLLDFAPESAKVTSEFKETPLHIAVKNNDISIEVIHALLKVYPESTKLKNPLGRTPLHNLCMNDMPRLDLIQALLEVAPEVSKWHCGTAECVGDLPIMWARRNEASPEAIAALEKAMNS